MHAELVVGIDVGGTRKGFHFASARPNESEVTDLRHFASVESLATFVRAMNASVLAAIDCPPRCQLKGSETRLSERQLHQRGFRVQWTRRQNLEPAEWMQNGQRLWEALAELPNVELIETFPTVATSSLESSELHLPLRLLAGFANQRDWKDFVDAAICVDVGIRYLRGEAQCVGIDASTGECDELGRIWF